MTDLDSLWENYDNFGVFDVNVIEEEEVEKNPLNVVIFIYQQKQKLHT